MNSQNKIKVRVRCEECEKIFEITLGEDIIKELTLTKNPKSDKLEDVEWHTMAFCPKCKHIKRVTFIRQKTPFVFR